STDDDRQVAARRNFSDPRLRIPGESPGAVSLAGVNEIQTEMRQASPLAPGGFGGADVQPTVDLTGIGRDDLQRPVSRERQRDRRLSYRGRPHDDRKVSAGQTGAPAP